MDSWFISVQCMDSLFTSVVLFVAEYSGLDGHSSRLYVSSRLIVIEQRWFPLCFPLFMYVNCLYFNLTGSASVNATTFAADYVALDHAGSCM